MEVINCNNANYVWYQVQKNDTLNIILEKFDVTKNNVIRNNPHVDLYEGEVVKVLKSTDILHIVKPRETLEAVAQKYNITIDDLVKLNHLSSKRLFVGQSLIIPKCKG